MLLPVLLALLAQAAPADANPLARGLAGDMQCYMPDTARKTCRSLATYKARADGSYDNGSSVLLSPQGPVILETMTPVTLKGQAVCGKLRNSDVAASKLRVAGQLLDAAQAAPILAQIQQAMTPILEKEICTTYAPEGDHLVAKVSIDGAYQAGQDQPVKWVSPSDGYAVAP